MVLIRAIAIWLTTLLLSLAVPSGVRERLDRITNATQQLQADIAATGGRPPARLLIYFDDG